jgi:hypothetical protein
MNLTECVLDTFIRRMVNINAMQFGFVPGQCTTDAIDRSTGDAYPS